MGRLIAVRPSLIVFTIADIAILWINRPHSVYIICLHALMEFICACDLRIYVKFLIHILLFNGRAGVAFTLSY